ncbi:MAG TPA: hypothetical protein PKU95_01885 [Candidatus Dojkabacteria bacterium]|nr:hypothetical protein [Candidatus Dojkabacteria bacterium]
MRLPLISTEQLTGYKEKGWVPQDLNPFMPEYSLESSTRAVVPYCPQAEGRWQSVRSDHIAEQAMHVLHFYDPETTDDSRLDLLEQETQYLRVMYKAYQERNGLAVFPDGKLMLVTPPVLGVLSNNTPIIASWPRDAKTEEINAICLSIRSELKLPLFALTVRVLNSSWSNIPALNE